MLGSKPRWLKRNVQNGNVYFDGTMSDHPKIAELNSKQFFFRYAMPSTPGSTLHNHFAPVPTVSRDPVRQVLLATITILLKSE